MFYSTPTLDLDTNTCNIYTSYYSNSLCLHILFHHPEILQSSPQRLSSIKIKFIYEMKKINNYNISNNNARDGKNILRCFLGEKMRFSNTFVKNKEIHAENSINRFLFVVGCTPLICKYIIATYIT